MKKFLSKYAFWILQIGGCFTLSLVTFILLGPSVKYISAALIVFASVFVIYFFPGIVLRFLYKRFVKENFFTVINLIKILIILIIVVVLIKELQLMYYIGYYTGRFIKASEIAIDYQNNFKPKTTATGVQRYIGTTILYGGWTILYFSIKALRKNVNSLVERSTLKNQIKQAQLNTLKGHINPNFMITSLKMIKELMLTDVAKSRVLLTKLSEVIRYSLTKNNINNVPFIDELEIVKSYVDLLNIEDVKKYEITYEINPETLNKEIPPMLLTNLMELATKYGILNLKEGGSVVLISKLKLSNIEIQCKHSGKMHRSEESDIIEKKIVQRLRLLFSTEASYKITHELNITTLVLDIPLKISENSI